MKKLTINSDITVIIPFFNGKAFIKKALLSLLNEITRADQIIIINDGSTRNDHVIFLKKLINNFPIPIKLVNKKQQILQLKNGRYVIALRIVSIDEEKSILII